jgi:hypothetical protein
METDNVPVNNISTTNQQATTEADGPFVDAYVCLDGCFVDNNPISVVPAHIVTLNLQVANARRVDLGSLSWTSFAKHVLSIGVRRVEALQHAHCQFSESTRDVIYIDESLPIRSSTQFDLDAHNLERLLECGRAAARAFLARKTTCDSNCESNCDPNCNSKCAETRAPDLVQADLVQADT